MSKQIMIFDTTLRDGEQSPGCSMNLQKKVNMVKQLEKLGVDIIEAGFPMTSNDDFLAVQTIARTAQNCVVAGLSRAIKYDIERTYEAIKDAKKPRIHLFLATSEIHMKYKLKKTPEEVLQITKEMVSYAKSLCEDIEFSAEDASRSDREFLIQVLNTAIDAGATVVNVPDTVGYATPEEMYDLIHYVKEHIHQSDKVTISVHCHNDLGMAVANTIAAIRAGATQVEVTVNGIGERAGNTSLEEVVMLLKTRKDAYPFTTNINTKQIYRTSKLLSTITGVPIAPTKPIVGANAFAHESGIHQHGVLSERTTYEIIEPESVGVYKNTMVLGKHSGRHAFLQRLEELGYTIAEDAVNPLFEKFKNLADRKKTVTDKDIEALVGSNAVGIPQIYSLHSFVVNSGTVISATAVVRLIKDGQEYEHVARGEGPIDAAFKAIDRIVKLGYPLQNYSINSVTEGEDALGEVVVKLQKDGMIITGRGLSTDIFEASINAYLNAINKAIAL